MNKKIITELIQNDCNSENIKFELNKILFDEMYKNNLINNYKLLKEVLGNSGASAKTAALIVNSL